MMVNFKSKVVTFSEMSVMISLAFVLHSFFKVLEMPNGGSINFGLTPLIIFSFRRNLLMGTISGFILSIIYFLSHPYIPPTDNLAKIIFSIFLDYILSYSCVGLASIFNNCSFNNKIKIIFGVSLVHIIRFLLFCTSGIAVWYVNTPFGGSVIKYVFIYNLTYCLPNFIADLLMCFALQKLCFNFKK